MRLSEHVLEEIAEDLGTAGRKVENGGNVIELRNGPIQTHVTLEAVSRSCEEGARITRILKVESEICGFTEDLDEQMMAGLNRHATLGGLVRDGGSGKFLVVSRIPLYEEDVKTMRFCVSLAATAALCQAESLMLFSADPVTVGMGKLIDEAPPGIGSMWGAEDFELAARFLKDMNLFVNADPGGLCVEFPLGNGAFSAIFGHRTSLLTLKNHFEHPAVGKGLLFVLKLMGTHKADVAASMAHHLNWKEYKGLGMAAMSGSWTTTTDEGGGRAGLAFTGFWPNTVYLQCSALELVVWMLYRNEWVKKELGDMA